MPPLGRLIPRDSAKPHRLLDGDDLDEPDVGILREQLGAVLAERGGNRPARVGLPTILRLESVEDSEGVLAHTEDSRTRPRAESGNA